MSTINIKVPNKETLKAFEETDNGKCTTRTLEEFEKYLDEIMKGEESKK
ncbi:hypothetical protein [Rickettsia bellii]|uniref:Uncharacterized protein n=2 Tax=Rickettsia bellii TaxID=33990 RepID=A0A0F3QH57_RICBE|nr:hypothetical protein [Rickettsia bellii]ABV78897.1 hypothetical protein A1I_02630 [Rickettsia bellii OSU 85-389]KJV89863.1 hypothetical protein RBEAN4_0852 [Rickettsia bellii str. RML An4]KJV91577.1 hypothetical protein RBEMOGI_0183 [Rickettsia bellii str. RML Mogi]